MKKLLMIALTIGMVFGVMACGSEEEGSDQRESEEFDGTVNATLSAATSGGFMYSVGASIGNIINKQEGSNLDVLEGGGIANIMGVNNKQFEYGLVFSQDIEDALNGENNFDEELQDFRVLAALYGGYLQVAVRSDSDIYSIEDLKGKSLSPGVKGYSAEALAQVVLDEYELTYDNLENVEFTTTSDATSLMQDRHIDAISAMFPIPFSAYQELDTSMGIRILPIDSERIDNLKEINSGYKEMVVPGGTYSGNEEDVTVPGSITLIITHKDTPDKEAYHMVESIVDESDDLMNLSVVFEDFNVNYAYENIVGPIHPGALKYYQDQGVAEKE